MDRWACEFFAGSIADWMMVCVTLLTGVAVAVLAYQANQTAITTRREAAENLQRRARTFGYMISVEVGGAQSAYYNLRQVLETEVDRTRIPSVDNIERAKKNLDLSFLPHVEQSMGNVDLLPEACAVPLLSGLATIATVRRSLKITLDAPANVDQGRLLTPTGMENVERVCSLLRSAEIRFRDAHRALFAFNFPGTLLVEWRYPEGARPPEG